MNLPTGMLLNKYNFYENNLYLYIIIIPLAFILGRLGGLQSIWFAFIFAELVTLILAVLLYKFHYHRHTQLLFQEQNPVI